MSKGAKSGIADKKVASAARLKITVEPLSDLLSLVHRLFQNLIGNALKFHEDGEPPLVKDRGGMLQEQDGVLASETVCRIFVALPMEQSGTQTQTNRDGANDYAAVGR